MKKGRGLEASIYAAGVILVFLKYIFYIAELSIILIKSVYKMCMYGKNVNLGVLEWQFSNFKFWSGNFIISKFWSGIKTIFPNNNYGCKRVG